MTAQPLNVRPDPRRLLLVGGASLALLSSCGSPTVCTDEFTSGATPADTAIVVGDSYSVSVFMRTCSGAVNLTDTLTFVSTEPDVASVTPSEGFVTGEASGQTSIGVSGKRYGHLAEIHVAVLPPPPLPCEPVTAGRDLTAEERAQLPPPAGRTPDQDWADIAREIPGGWGGVFFANNQLTTYLVDPTSWVEVLDTLQALRVAGPIYDMRQAVVWCGRWSFAQLYDWSEYIRGAIDWPPEGLHSRDHDESENRIEYTFVDAQTADAFQALVADLGLPSDLVVIDVR